MVLDSDPASGRVAFTTKTLERAHGDMLRDPQMVFDNAEATGAAFRERMAAERATREAQAAAQAAAQAEVQAQTDPAASGQREGTTSGDAGGAIGASQPVRRARPIKASPATKQVSDFEAFLASLTGKERQQGKSELGL